MPVCGQDPRVANRVLAPRYAHEIKMWTLPGPRRGCSLILPRKLKTGMFTKIHGIRNGEQPQASPLLPSSSTSQPRPPDAHHWAWEAGLLTPVPCATSTASVSRPG